MADIYYIRTREINRELMREIWLLWAFRDVPVIRHLDWHLPFNRTMIAMAEKTFRTPEDYARTGPRFVTQTRDDSVNFIRVLHHEYQKALIARDSNDAVMDEDQDAIYNIEDEPFRDLTPYFALFLREWDR